MGFLQGFAGYLGSRRASVFSEFHILSLVSHAVWYSHWSGLVQANSPLPLIS